MTLSIEMQDWLRRYLRDPGKKLAQVQAELTVISPEEWIEDNSGFVQPFGREDIRLELDNLIKRYGTDARVDQFVKVERGCCAK
jgi:hypothetical protein